MRETITIQVGQCGNQIGTQFWNLLLHEHEHTPDDDDALSAFFRFAPVPGKNGKTHAMKARALLVDMECGPLQETMRGPMGSLFDETQYVMDVSGAGNNFAQGFANYGPTYRNSFEEGLRRNAEHCDSLQTFLVTHSLGGGTGSGVGSYIIGLLAELYPKIYRFSSCVYPSKENDVVTSPYNTMLSTRELIEHADCVFPLDNSSLFAFSRLETSGNKPGAEKEQESLQNIGGTRKKRDKGFDAINGVAARMLCHLTSSSRFHGEMNVDMNEIYSNLVPFPRLHFLMTALSVRQAINGSNGANRTRDSSRAALQRSFTDILSPRGQLTAANPVASNCITLASSFLGRGNISLSDYLTCVTTAQQKTLRFPHWNQNACK
eukprot:gene13995-18768_t